VLVVGGGPSGLSAAATLAQAGVGGVEVLEREQEAGGIPRHSVHLGYGLKDLHRMMTGPAYARLCVKNAADAGVSIRTGVSVTGWAGPLTFDVTAPTGLERIKARAVVLATGARERPRAARLVAGSRPRGVFTTGELQQAVYLKNQTIGSRAVIVGAEHVSFSAVLTLAHAGVQVAAMVTEFPRHQTWAAFRIGIRARHSFSLLTRSRVTRIIGRGRVEAVEVVTGAGRRIRIPCDTVVFTGNWIPDHELARRGGLEMDSGTKGPAVSPDLRTSVPGVFAVGNLTHPVLTADVAALDGRYVAEAVLRHREGLQGPGATVSLRVEQPLRWISPNRLRTASSAARQSFQLWSDDFVSRPTIEVVQGSRLLHTQRLRRDVVPQRPARLDSTWSESADPAGPAVVIRINGCQPN
jgi:thioredoxin reductase